MDAVTRCPALRHRQDARALPRRRRRRAAGSGGRHPGDRLGDTFLYYSPDGRVPRAGQPFATAVTKDYPGEPASGLDRPGAFRVNVHAGAEAFEAHCGHGPREASPPDGVDHRHRDVVLPHPVYARLGWVCVVDPAERSAAATRELLTTAHRLAALRHRRRSGER
ncbi:hypothetical protein CLV92_11525 [Kineococcus xinjiangensis]|uniref:DUF6194 domain-containing protein n=1 Tax=Kineococcus xinjiangensis TaxID=512762 RepID=A0A2S6IDK4_9ACTN|nr:DUF6194 family protein [Kineococcus xinjiangensis]PPK92279.1 hypothetical protein CLV92_11525 [Kineococcus xinjiangensis]